MDPLLLNIIIAVVFLGGILLIWTGIQIWAQKRLGYRKQGCKGPTQGEDGEMLCCKGDGSLCTEADGESDHNGSPER